MRRYRDKRNLVVSDAVRAFGNRHGVYTTRVLQHLLSELDSSHDTYQRPFCTQILRH
jgi:hypothetical protein